MPDIFLCYRSGDDAYAAALLDEKLSQAFGAAAIFRASRSILPGESYSEAIFRALDRCNTMLVIVGPTWMERLRGISASTEDDWVRTEIAKALNSTTRVIPVLLSRTPRLERSTLPPDISDLAEKQYLKFEHRSVTRDVEQLITALQQTGPRSSAEHVTATMTKPARPCFRRPGSAQWYRQLLQAPKRKRPELYLAASHAEHKRQYAYSGRGGNRFIKQCRIGRVVWRITCHSACRGV